MPARPGRPIREPPADELGANSSLSPDHRSGWAGAHHCFTFGFGRPSLWIWICDRETLPAAFLTVTLTPSLDSFPCAAFERSCLLSRSALSDSVTVTAVAGLRRTTTSCPFESVIDFA